MPAGKSAMLLLWFVASLSVLFFVGDCAGRGGDSLASPPMLVGRGGFAGGRGEDGQRSAVAGCAALREGKLLRLRGGMPAPWGNLASDYGEVEVAEQFAGEDTYGDPAPDGDEEEEEWDEDDDDSESQRVIDIDEVEKEQKRGTFEADELQPEHGNKKLG
jgi:hypothetical protein